MHDIRGSDSGKIVSGRSPSPDLSGVRILVADDNAVNRFIMARVLDLAGAEAVVVRDGMEAVAAWKSQPFDLVLLDISMPNMDGISALVAIREHESAAARPAPVAVAVTAHTMKHELDSYETAGFYGTISKPLRFPAVYEEICAALAARSHWNDDRACATGS